MSTTICGYYKFSTGEITFDNLETCLEQSACFVVSGVHEGQIALTLSGADDEDCNDTFYGCVDPINGRFSVSISENCCIEPGDDCQFCEPDKTPENILLVFNVNDCLCNVSGDMDIQNINDREFVLTQQQSPCYYQYNETADFGHVYRYDNINCTEPIVCLLDLNKIIISASIQSNKKLLVTAKLNHVERIGSDCHLGTDYGLYLFGVFSGYIDIEEDDCITNGAIGNNLLIQSNCFNFLGLYGADYGGTVQVFI